ncbi:MAG: hypothetical protein ACI8P0_001307, partial [Planctomycetaceae bacterium]
MIAVESFVGAYGTFTKNAELNGILLPLNQAILAAWEGTRTDGLAAGGSSSWLKQPVPYVEPHLGRLRVQELESDDETGNSDKRTRLPDGQVDHASRYKWLIEDEERRNAVTDKMQAEFAREELLRLLVDKGADSDDQTNSDESSSPADGHISEVTSASSRIRRRIVIAEDSNAGKTVLSKRLAAFFADPVTWDELLDVLPPLILRWENGRSGSSHHWPASLHDLIDQLHTAVCVDQPGLSERWTPETIVKELLAQGRVVLILDSADQASRNHPLPTELLKDALLADGTTFARCIVIVTGRSHSFSASQKDRFPKDVWTHFGIMGFSEAQQRRFLTSVIADGKELQDLFADYPAIKELLSVAGMIEMVLGLLRHEKEKVIHQLKLPDDARPAISLPRLKTRADFYWECLQERVFPAETNSPDGHLRSSATSGDDYERFRCMAAVAAFRMVLLRAVGYTVEEDHIAYVRNDVVNYVNCFAELTGRSFLKCEHPDEDWERLRSFSPLSDHGVLENSSRDILSFRHKGWMEFFAGLFLAKYADPVCLAQFDFSNIHPPVEPENRRWPGFIEVNLHTLQEQAAQQVDAAARAQMRPLSMLDRCINLLLRISGRPEIGSAPPVDPQSPQVSIEERRHELLFDDVLLQVTNDPDWYWMWRFAIDLPRYTPEKKTLPDGPEDRGRLGRSLSCLLLQPKREIRPNELAWRAFHLFETDEQTPPELRAVADRIPKHVRRRALERFRTSSRELVAEIEANTRRQRTRNTTQFFDKWLTWRHRESRHDAWLQEWQNERCHVKSRTLVQCPPQSWIDEFEAGQRDDPRINMMGDNPEHRLKVEAFEAFATPLNRGLYECFDSAFESSQVATSWGGVISTENVRVASPPDGSTGEQAESSLYPVLTADWYDGWFV